MNTRLQVEHPVTELRRRGARPGRSCSCAVAAGEPLPFTQDDVTLHGHAIEARVYAEDAFHGFLPQAGTSRERWSRWPTAAPAVDAALRVGQVVSAPPTTRCSARSSCTAPTGRRPPRAGRRARRHRDPRADHQRRLPARAGRDRRVPRRDDRHRLARQRTGRRARPRTPPACSPPGPGAGRTTDAAGDEPPVPGRRLAARRADPAPVVVELDRAGASSTAPPAPSTASGVTQLARGAAPGGAQHRRPPRAGARRRRRRTRSRSPTAASAGSFTRPDVFARPDGRRRRRHASPRRCPAPCCRSRVADGQQVEAGDVLGRAWRR